MPLYSGLPHILYVSNPVGAYQAPNWTSIPHTATVPDGSVESFSYSGLRPTTIDPNNHQKVQEKDAF